MQSGFAAGAGKSGPFKVGGKIKIPRIAATQAFVDVELRGLERSFDFAGEEAYYVILITHSKKSKKPKRTKQGLQNSINFRIRKKNRESSVI